MKKTLLIGNWKMNPRTLREAMDLFNATAKGVENVKGTEVVLCPPFVFLPYIRKTKYRVRLGGQNAFWMKSGAFTGEVSPSMLRSLGCSYVIVGHSERKKYLGETLSMINKKVLAVLDEKLIPVVCIGEREKNSGNARQEVLYQMEEIFDHVKITSASNVVVVYEPEWAISTWSKGISATPEYTANVIEWMRESLGKIFGPRIGNEIRILYGGSVNSTNVRDFMEKGGVQGALVGSASLHAKEFIRLVKHSVI